MTARLYQFPIERRIPDIVPQIPSTIQMTTELLRDHGDELTRNELTIVHYAKQLAELEIDNPMYMRYVHQIYIRFNPPALTLRQRLAQFFTGKRGAK